MCYLQVHNEERAVPGAPGRISTERGQAKPAELDVPGDDGVHALRRPQQPALALCRPLLERGRRRQVRQHVSEHEGNGRKASGALLMRSSIVVCMSTEFRRAVCWVLGDHGVCSFKCDSHGLYVGYWAQLQQQQQAVLVLG